ncbi:MAG TPA: hypothetical protein VE863_15430 [Pyrinomonadaceae bacterium]|jgi:hypothetical protein|nr:hypothetical protein [Pyrinomonadaceae bacterium]
MSIAKRSFLLLILVNLVVLVFISSPTDESAQLSPNLVAGYPGASLEGSETMVTALPVINRTKEDASRVLVTGLSIEGGSLATKLPIELGTIKAGEQGTVFATFTRGPFTAGKTYLLRAEGTLSLGGRLSKFEVQHEVRIPPAAPGKDAAKPSTSTPKRVKGAPYPAEPPRFNDEVNTPSKWTVPVGTYHQPQPRSKESETQKAPGSRQHHALASPPAVSFFTNDGLGISSSSVNEPSGGAAGQVVFATANWFAAYSTNGGSSFTRLNPTTVFPNNMGGYCCDQVVVYVPRIDRMIWLLQYGQGYRIAAASPATIRTSSGTAWTYWDITAAQLGFGGGVDFPDLSVGDNSLYVDFDQGPGLVVVRIPLAEIAASATIHFWYTDPNNSTMAYFGQLTQNPHDEIFWAGHNSNSSMRVFSWQESSTTYFWRDVSVGSWPNNNVNLKSLTPDRQDWVSKLRDDNNNFIQGSTRVLGGARQANQVWFAWTAPSGQGFPQTHVQWVALDRNNNFNLITQQQIWNPNYAFAYPALSTNSNDEVGLSLEYGGGGNYENHVVGFWGDFIVYTTTSSNLGIGRFGDYVTLRQDATHPERFDAFGYGMNSSPTRSDTRYVVFGR